MSRVQLHYTFAGSHHTIVTLDREWHELMKLIRHECAAGLELVELYVEKEFWDVADWKAGPQKVLEGMGYDPNIHREPKTFLYRLAKLAGYAWRWRMDDKIISATVGCELDLNIHGTNTAEKAALVAQLEYEMRSIMTGDDRPFFFNDVWHSVFKTPLW